LRLIVLMPQSLPRLIVSRSPECVTDLATKASRFVLGLSTGDKGKRRVRGKNAAPRQLATSKRGGKPWPCTHNPPNGHGFHGLSKHATQANLGRPATGQDGMSAVPLMADASGPGDRHRQQCANKRLMHCNMSANRETASRRSLRNPIRRVASHLCARRKT